jgi:hypothetical protein
VIAVAVLLVSGLLLSSSIGLTALVDAKKSKHSGSSNSASNSNDNTNSNSGGSNGDNSKPSNDNSNTPPSSSPETNGGNSKPDNTGGSQSQGNTGSTNQQLCPNGEHFSKKKNKCVEDTSNQRGQGGTMSAENVTNNSNNLVAANAKSPETCVGDFHRDVRAVTNFSGSKGACVSNELTLPDGSCVAGYHLIIGSKPPLCRQDTATTTTATQDTNRNLGGLICVKGTC